jgi:hypothetical protein
MIIKASYLLSRICVTIPEKLLPKEADLRNQVPKELFDIICCNDIFIIPPEEYYSLPVFVKQELDVLKF